MLEQSYHTDLEVLEPAAQLFCVFCSILAPAALISVFAARAIAVHGGQVQGSSASGIGSVHVFPTADDCFHQLDLPPTRDLHSQ